MLPNRAFIYAKQMGDGQNCLYKKTSSSLIQSIQEQKDEMYRRYMEQKEQQRLAAEQERLIEEAIEEQLEEQLEDVVAKALKDIFKDWK